MRDGGFGKSYGGPIIPERRRIAVASNHNILARTDKSDAKRLPTFATVRRDGQ